MNAQLPRAILVCALIPFLVNAEDATLHQKGDVLLSGSFETEAKFKSHWSGAVNACVIADGVLKITKSSTTKDNSGLIHTTLAMPRLRGTTFQVRARVKGENVTSAKLSHEGTRFLFMTKVNGSMLYRTVDLPTGSFDWKDVELNVTVPDEPLDTGLFKLGLDASSGTWWVKDLTITVVEAAQPASVAVEGVRSKGHTLPALRGMTFPNKFTEQDYIDLGTWNVNSGRWNIGNWNGERFPGGLSGKNFDALFEKEVANTDVIVALARKQGIHVVLCMGGSSPKFGLFDSPANQAKFIACWKHLAERYKSDTTVILYDLVNEPHEDEWKKENGVLTYNELMSATALAIRAIDPAKGIAIEPASGGSKPDGFYTLKPVPVPNVVYSPHMYAPMGVTHQGLYGNPDGVSYPGMVNGEFWDKAQLERYLKPAIDFQKRYNVHIYVGELSCIRWAPNGSAARWLTDTLEILERHGWDWNFHGFREFDGWDVEFIDDTRERKRATETSDRAKVLRGWYGKNQKPDWYKK